MDISCGLITTNINNRKEFLIKAVNSVELFNDYFYEKIMSVDYFLNGIDKDWFNKFNWNVSFKDANTVRSMILNQKNLLLRIASDFIFYMEDDVIVNSIPKISTLDKLFNSDYIEGKKTGFICYNTHVLIDYRSERKDIVNFINDLNNYVIINDDVFLIKRNVLKDIYYLNFPVVITKKDFFVDMQNYCFEHLINTKTGVEQGMTKAWFDLKYDNEYHVLIYVNSRIISDIKNGKKISLVDFHNYANIDFANNKGYLGKTINRNNTLF